MNGAQIILEKDDLWTAVVLNHQNEQDVDSGWRKVKKSTEHLST